MTDFAAAKAAAPVASPERAGCHDRQLPVPVVGFNLVEPAEGEGYGSKAILASIERVAQTGSNVVAFVVAARLASTASNALRLAGVPSSDNLAAALRHARAKGLRTLVVPHLWIDGGQWRGHIVRSGADADAFFAAYGAYLQGVAAAAEQGCADGLSLGVELKGLTTSVEHRARFAQLITALRARFHGLLTYSANWDEAAGVGFWRELDLVSVNGFYPLAQSAAPSGDELRQGAYRLATDLDALSVKFERPVLLIEAGYKATTDNAQRPWEWPAGDLPVDEEAQERAYTALCFALRDQPRVVGTVFWLLPTGSDRADAPAFEPAFGFAPLGKRAEAVVRSQARWAQEQRKLGRNVVPVGPTAPRRRP